VARTVIAVVFLVLGLSYLVQVRLWTTLIREILERPHRFLLPSVGLLVVGLALIAGRGPEALRRPGVVGLYNFSGIRIMQNVKGKKQNF